MADLQGFGRALQGFGAGVAGRGQQFLQGLDDNRKNALLQDAFAVQQQLTSGDISGARATLMSRLDAGNRLGGAVMSDTQALLQKLESGDVAGALTDVGTVVNFAQRQGLLKSPEQDKRDTQTAGEREFASLIKGLPTKQQEEAKLIKLGLSPRAVGSAIQTIAESGTAELIGDAEATVAQRKKFGELTGSSRAKRIDSNFERIGKIDAGILTIDRAIAAIEDGAGTGALERFLPSFKAASVELDNIQKQLALDVIGGVTLGAISAAELDLAKQVGLPAGLDGPELIKHLQDRKAAQGNLRDYFNEQIQFLDQGGTVAGFLREKERGQGQSAAPAAPAQAAAPGQDLSQFSDKQLQQMLQGAQ